VLLLAAYSAIGLFISSLTPHPLLAGFGTLMAVIFLMLLNLLATDPNATSNYLSLLSHFELLSKGLIDTANLAFLMIVTTTLLILVSKILDAAGCRAKWNSIAKPPPTQLAFLAVRGPAAIAGRLVGGRHAHLPQELGRDAERPQQPEPGQHRAAQKNAGTGQYHGVSGAGTGWAMR